jgi:hypothetical protein
MEMNDELLRTYRSRDFKTYTLDSTRTQLQHTLDDELLPQDEEPEEDPEEVQGMSGVEDK